MRKFILRRLALGALIVLLGSLVVYTVIRCLPSSYVETIARQRANLPGGRSYTEWLTQLNQVYGLDQGILRGFVHWLGNAFRGEFGESWLYNLPVTVKFLNVIWYSVVVNIITFALEIVGLSGDGRVWMGALYALLSLLLGVSAVVTGRILAA